MTMLTKEKIVCDYVQCQKRLFVTMYSDRNFPNTAQYLTKEDTITVTRYCFVTILTKEGTVL